MESTRELETLIECNEYLKVCFRNNLDDIALFLRQKYIISHEKYRESTDIKSALSMDEKAHIILQALQDKVQEDKDCFHTFLEYLSSKQKYFKLKESVCEEYDKQGKQSNTKQSCQSTLQCTSRDLTFQALQHVSGQEQVIAQLKHESNEMIREFDCICRCFSNYLSTSAVDLRPLKVILKRYIKCGTIYDEEEDLTANDVKNMDNITAIMDAISSYCSFFNFTLFENAINEVKFMKGIELMEGYKKKFAVYVSRRITKCPYGIGMKGEHHTSLKVVLDKTYINCKLEHILKLKADICEILSINPQDLQIEGVIQGSICVTFHVHLSVKSFVFPLTTLQINSIRKLKYMGAEIQMITCDEFTYEIQQQPLAQSLTLRNIKNVLKQNEISSRNAAILGEQLGLSKDTIESIIQDNGGVDGDWEKIYSDILKSWHNSDLEISWDKLSEALSNCGYTDVNMILSTEQVNVLDTTGFRQPRKRVLQGAEDISSQEDRNSGISSEYSSQEVKLTAFISEHVQVLHIPKIPDRSREISQEVMEPDPLSEKSHHENVFGNLSLPDQEFDAPYKRKTTIYKSLQEDLKSEDKETCTPASYAEIKDEGKQVLLSQHSLAMLLLLFLLIFIIAMIIIYLIWL